MSSSEPNTLPLSIISSHKCASCYLIFIPVSGIMLLFSIIDLNYRRFAVVCNIHNENVILHDCLSQNKEMYHLPDNTVMMAANALIFKPSMKLLEVNNSKHISKKPRLSSIMYKNSDITDNQRTPVTYRERNFMNC